MLKILTLRNKMALFMLAFGFTALTAQTIWKETFSNQAASLANWVQTGTNSGANNLNWAWTDNISAGAWQPGDFKAPTATDGYMWFDSDGNGQGAHDLRLTNVPIPVNCTGKKDVRFRVYTYYRTFSGADKATIGFSTNGSTFTHRDIKQFDDLVEETPASGPQIFHGWIEIDVNEADNAPQVWIQFRWQGDFEYYWKIDDIELYEYQAPNATVTFQVNMSQVTLDPAGAKIAGTFTNWSDANMTNAGGGIWTYTTSLPQGEEVLWKFKNGPNGWENVTPACGKPDGFGGFNRVYKVGNTATITLPAVCFNSCDPCKVDCKSDPNAIICDNIDSYDPTKRIAIQSPHWTCWSGPSAEGTAEDGLVTNERAASAPYSMKVFSTVAGGGPQDVVLDLGNRKTGRYSVKWKYFVPTGNTGYYNFQNVVPIAGGAWNLEVFFNANGAGSTSVSSTTPFTFKYENGKWLQLEHIIDLDNNLFKFYIDGKFSGAMAWPNDLGGVNFYPTGVGSTMFVDDVEYVQLTPVSFNADICEKAVDLTPLIGGAPGVPQVSALQNNNDATVSPSDPPANTLCFADLVNGQTPAPKLDGTLWYTFPGDGNKYKIQTIPCSAGNNYIGLAQDDPGDTQMAIFTGDDCTKLTQVACNDDLFSNGQPDWRAGFNTFQTTAGTNYYMLIDGFNFQNVVAKGQFCIEFTRLPDVDCSAGKVGTVNLAKNGYVCFNENLNTIMQPDASSFVIPTIGPVFGMCWCITQAPLDPNVWPGSVPGIASTAFSTTIGTVNLPNSGNPFAPGVYYLTPVVAAGGTLINPAQPARIFNVDISSGCFFVGESKRLVLMPNPTALKPITGTIVQQPGPSGTLLNLTPAGGIAEFLGDPTLYKYLWSTGATTQDITVTTGGGYSVTISDPSGCTGINPAVVQVTSAQDPETVKSIVLSPNPTTGSLNLNIQLDAAADLRIEVVNSIGQVLRTQDFGKVSTINQIINLENLAAGTYFIRFNIEGKMTYRSIMIQR